VKGGPRGPPPLQWGPGPRRHFTAQYLEHFRGPALEDVRRNLHILLMEVFRVAFCYLAQKVLAPPYPPIPFPPLSLSPN